MTHPVLVFGANGQTGRQILSHAKQHGIECVGLSRADADIADRDSIASRIAEFHPRVIINAAAYTAVDKAEVEPIDAKIANAVGPRNLAEASAAAGIPIVHFSTDYVFDGRKTTAYVETDPVSPLGVYGRTKSEGEQAVRDANRCHIIIRTSWVYGVNGNNFLKTILRLAAERDELRVVADQRGCPTSTADLAEALSVLDRKISEGTPRWGTYHLAGTGATTWHGFASAIVDARASRTGHSPLVTAIATRDYPTAAARPVNSELDSSLFASQFGFTGLPWRTRVLECVEQILQAQEKERL